MAFFKSYEKTRKQNTASEDIQVASFCNRRDTNVHGEILKCYVSAPGGAQYILVEPATYQHLKIFCSGFNKELHEAE